MKISFIIPLYNNMAATKAMLASLASSIKTGPSHEIILVDDGSQDGTRDWLSAASLPNTRVILNERNLGYSKSNNIGAGRARGDYLFLLNNDLLLQPGWLQPMLDVLEQDGQRIGIVGNVQTRVSNGSIDHAGVRLNLNAQFEHIRTLAENPKQSIECFAVTGACVALRRADFESVNGFDEDFVNGCEDIDLCLKLRARSRQVHVALQSKVQHHVSLTRSSATLRDVTNSRTLFRKWRHEIKAHLADAWLRNLNSARPMLSLTENMRRKKHTAAVLAAEAAIRREEYHWSRTIDSRDPNRNAKLTNSGAAATAHGRPGTSACAEHDIFRITVAGLYSVHKISFHARLAPYAQNLRNGRLQINVNDISVHSAGMTPGGNIRVELHRPLIVADSLNTFTIAVLARYSKNHAFQALPFDLIRMVADDVVLVDRPH